MSSKPETVDVAKQVLADAKRSGSRRRAADDTVSHPYSFSDKRLQDLLDRSREDFIEDIGEMIADILAIKKTTPLSPLELDVAWLAFVAHKNAFFTANSLPAPSQAPRRAVFEAVLKDVLADNYLKPEVKR